MVQGRGIYMADNPSECFKYGNKLILSKVLLGEKDYTQGSIFVIRKEEQILPYCVINFLDDDPQNMSNCVGMGMGMGMGPISLGVPGPQITSGNFMGSGFLPIGSGVLATQTTSGKLIIQQPQVTMNSGLCQSQNSMSPAGLQQIGITQQPPVTMSSGLSQSQNSMSSVGLQQIKIGPGGKTHPSQIMGPRPPFIMGPRGQSTMGSGNFMGSRGPQQTMMHQVGYTIGSRMHPPNSPRYPWTSSARYNSP